MNVRVAVFGALLCCSVAVSAQAQFPDRSVELFGTLTLVGGLTPVRVDSATRITPHGGARIEGGIQGEQIAVGLGFRYWEAVKTAGVGTLGADLLLVGEWRASRDAHTTLRLSTGIGSESVDGLSGVSPYDEYSHGEGIITWSVGVGREFVLPDLGRGAVSADLVVPPVNASRNGRRRPVLEFGLSYRWRFFQAVRMPGGR